MSLNGANGSVLDARSRPLGALRAQNLMDLVGLRLAPALTAGIIAWLHSRDLGEALIVFAAMFAAFQLVERSGFPMSLMPAARLGVGLIAPVLAAAAMIGVTALAGNAADPSNFYAAIAGAWVMLGLGAWMKTQMERTAWARVAVIGSPRFAKDLRDELQHDGCARLRGDRVVRQRGALRAGSLVAQLARLAGSRPRRSAGPQRRPHRRRRRPRVRAWLRAGSWSLGARRQCLPRPPRPHDRCQPVLRGPARPRPARDHRPGLVPLRAAPTLPVDRARLPSARSTWCSPGSSGSSPPR